MIHGMSWLQVSISSFAHMGAGALRWARSWWRVLFWGAQMVVLALSPSSYKGHYKRRILGHIYVSTAPILPWFVALSALISLVIVRIVWTTALSYGLTGYALEVLTRTLVLELIPLVSALFVALRVTMPGAQTAAAMAQHHQGLLLWPLLPRAIAGVVAVYTLAAISSTVALALSYLTVYGLSPWGVSAFTAMIGEVFSLDVVVVFVVKTTLFALAVSVVPLGAAVVDPHSQLKVAELKAFARLFSTLLLIEALSLLGSYA
jgi:phospholipid/cholesterol/gamma-HCH transport system permease protein